jgi:SAM-dependent methyltransferase
MRTNQNPTIELSLAGPAKSSDNKATRPQASTPPTSNSAGNSQGVRQRSATNERLLGEITAYCQRTGLAESTFGRRAVNDGKLVTRLRFGGRVTTHTAERVRNHIARSLSDLGMDAAKTAVTNPTTNSVPNMAPGLSQTAQGASKSSGRASDNATPFRFYDNRQKYLLFVNTCTEKWVVSQRIEMELEHIKPRAPAMRVFDAGVGDGTVITRVMRTMHDRFPTVPFYIVGKEISLEDVRLALEKMPDRFYEHPSTVLVMTNMYYSEAPWLRPNTLAAASGLVWNEVALKGNTAGQFERQITDLQGFLAKNWTAKMSPTTGNPIYERPVVLVIYRDDHKLLLDNVRPKQGAVRADFDLVIASQPYRARVPVEFKASKVVAPLARALGPGGRLIGIHSAGNDPGLEIVQGIWPDEQPFTTDRHQLLKATKQVLGSEARTLNFNAYSDQRAFFKYDMHTLPSEISSSIGTSTLMAAWNAAVYVAQIEDQRLEPVMSDGKYLDVTREVLQRHGKLWFQNESYVISRHRHDS